MSTEIQAHKEVQPEILELVLLHGDLSKLTPEQRVEYMLGVCKSLKLNPLTKPFDYLNLQGKLVMYAKRDCAEQLRKIHGVTIEIISRELHDDVYVVTARAIDSNGRRDESTGAVVFGNLKGEAKANAAMKAETKAKRRVTLSICGLGLPSEDELEEPIKKAKTAPVGDAEGVDFPPRQDEPQSKVGNGGDWVVNFGTRYYGKRIREIPVEDLKGAIQFFHDDSKKSGKPLTQSATKFIRNAEEYFRELEGIEHGR